ncbi:MAG: hypothetical protein Tsb005_17150 [Gammaproteobacteria bacterium]
MLGLERPAWGFSPWLPVPHELDISAIATKEEFQEFWSGKRRGELLGKVEITRYLLGVNFGINDYLAFDAFGGYVRSHYDPGRDPVLSGRDDTYLGLRWRMIDELIHNFPTVTLRVGGTIRGNYEPSSRGNPHGPRERADSLEADILVGKLLPKQFAISAHAGYRIQQNPVPSDRFVGVSLSQNITEHWSWNISWEYTESVTGDDLNSPSFTGSELGFRGLRDVSNIAEARLGYTFNTKGTLSASVAQTFDGRNSPDSRIFSIAFTQPFFLP